LSIDNIHQLLDWHPPHRESLIEEGILLPETTMMIFGQAGAWKSMLSIYTAFTIANGSPWFGYKTKQAATFKYQTELPKAIDRDRIAKYAKGANSYPDLVFFKTVYERVKLDTSWGIASFNKDIEEVMSRSPDKHLVIIIDPLYMFLAGHISDEYDVKKMQDNLKESKTKLSYSLILIHHSRLTRIDSSGGIVDLGAEEVMGSSYWNNWCDTMVRVRLLNPNSGSNHIELSFAKVRNAETVMPSFEVKWDRANLQPAVVSRAKVEEEISIRGTKEEE